MGCASSKLDDTEAVLRCRHRVGFLDGALRQRYALAEAHFAYLHSLESVGNSLHHFFNSAAVAADLASAAPPSPVLNLPSHRKGDPEEEEGEQEQHPKHHLQSPGPSSSHLGSGHHLSHSDSDSHIHFQDSDEEELGESELGLHSSSPPLVLPHEQGMYQNLQGMGLGLGINHGDYPAVYARMHMNHGEYPAGPGYTTMHMNYMKKQPTPSVSYQQKPVGTESIQMGTANPAYHPYYKANQNPNSYMANQNPNSYFQGDPYDAGGGGYMGYVGGGGGGGGGGMGGFFGGAPAGEPGGGSASSYKQQQQQPPPPPPPPSTSTWDFLNPFGNIEDSYPAYTPSRASRDSREVREEEGIPDLEDEDYQHEEVKLVHGHQKLVDEGGGSSSGGRRKSYPKAPETGGNGVAEAEGGYRARPSVSPEPDPLEFQVHMVDKNVVGEEGRRSEEQSNVGAVNGRGGGFRNVSDVLVEIQVQFKRASASGAELAKMLEVGKLPYQRKTSAYQVSSKMLCAVTPSIPSASKDLEASSSSAADFDEDIGLSSGSLSATLQKLFLWEKKLFEEVKVEEKMRVVHDKKVEKLQKLVERGAEAHKVDATRAAIRDISTKIGISIQIIDKISVKISKLRDEDLWLRLNELIQGLARMWKGMLECHHNQSQAVEGARGLDAIAFSKHSGDAHLEAVLQLERELINWTSRFSNWIDTQKGYVKALNEWLLKCLVCEPEETPDGMAPFSPGRAGAPIIFIICNQWAQALDRLSEKEVVDSMRVFAAMVFKFWERDKLEMRQRIVADKDVERKVKDLERQDVRIQKQIQALDKRMLLSSGDANTLSLSGSVVYQSDTSNNTGLQAGLQHIFAAMDRYTSESLKVYEDLLSRSEEVARERSGVRQ